MSVGALFSSLSGLNAHRRILDTTAHNISNQLTPGYKRQVVDLAPQGVGTGAQVFSGPGSKALGVDVLDTRRVLDDLGEVRARNAVAAATDATGEFESMIQIEQVFGEPGATGLSNQFDEFWVSWSDLADRADNVVERGEVLSRASSIAERFQATSGDLDEIDTDAVRRMNVMVSEINTLAKQVADLNGAIASSPETPNRLLDQRDEMASQLASLVGAEVRPTSRGMVALSVGGRLLVGDGIAYEVTTDGADITWVPDGAGLRGGPSELTALQRLRTETIPETKAQLDAIAEAFVTEVNDLHRQGFGLDGVDGRDFFDPAGTTAATIQVSADVLGDPERVAAGAPVMPGGTAPGVFDGRMAQRIGDLAVDGAATADYRAFVADIGIRANSAGRRAETANSIANRAIDEAESVSGVSVDEELATMMAAQRAYEASARVLRTVDEMMQTVIGLIR
ncbi:MAG: flagellar hook-associated protein FlgK [Actinomycetota bacterium]